MYLRLRQFRNPTLAPRGACGVNGREKSSTGGGPRGPVARILALLTLLLAAAASAAGCPGVGTGNVDVVLIRGEEWGGVDVYDNRLPHSEPVNYEYGQKWQCVELVQRLYAKKWGYPPIWPVRYGYQMFDKAPPGIERHRNGAGPSSPVPGDAVIFDRLHEEDIGHVSVVTAVEGGVVSLVHQNFGDDGRATITIDENGNLGKLAGFRPLGWLHPAREYSGPGRLVGGGASNTFLAVALATIIACLALAFFFLRHGRETGGPRRVGAEDGARPGRRISGNCRRTRLLAVAGMALFLAVFAGSSVLIAFQVTAPGSELFPHAYAGRSIVSIQTRLLILSATWLAVAGMCASAELMFSRIVRRCRTPRAS